MPENDNPPKSAELSAAQNCNMIGGTLNSGPAPVLPPGKSRRIRCGRSRPNTAAGSAGIVDKKRRRYVYLHVMAAPEDQALIHERMAGPGIALLLQMLPGCFVLPQGKITMEFSF